MTESETENGSVNNWEARRTGETRNRWRARERQRGREAQEKRQRTKRRTRKGGRKTVTCDRSERTGEPGKDLLPN